MTARPFAIKADVREPRAAVHAFEDQKTMYGGKHIAPGDVVYVFASENSGGTGLVARGVVAEARATPKKFGMARQTPRVSITIVSCVPARRRLGRAELKPHDRWDDGQPQTELNFKFYRQATDKIVGITPQAASFLDRCFA